MIQVKKIKEILTHFCKETFFEFSRDTKSDAESLLNCIQQFPFISLLNFWHPILSSVQKVPKRLQDPKMGFHEASCDLKGFVQIFNLKNDEMQYIQLMNIVKNGGYQLHEQEEE